MGQVISELRAIAHSGKFTPFIKGVALTLPTGQTLEVKVQSTTPWIRPMGLRFSKFSFVTEVTAGDFTGYGYGEAGSRLVSIQKSVAEGVERAIYRALKGTSFGTRNSNGWAAHLNVQKAEQSALQELLERDAVLVHWFCQIPMTEISPTASPAWLKRWIKNELSRSTDFCALRILMSHQGYVPTLTTVLLNEHGNAVTSHATASSMNEALYKALAETCRIAEIALERDFFETSLSLDQSDSTDAFKPEDHAMLYAYHRKFPDWIFGIVKTWREAEDSWKHHHSNFQAAAVESVFHPVVDGPLAVGYCTSAKVQSLFFGRTEHAQKQGLLNLDRLRRVKQEGDFNLLPHFVP